MMMNRLNSTNAMSQVEETTELTAALEAIVEYLDSHAECKKWSTDQWSEWLSDNSFSLQQLQNDAQKVFREFTEIDALTELQSNLHQNNNVPTLELIQQWQSVHQSITLEQLITKATADANEVQNLKKTAGGTSKVDIGIVVTARLGATGIVTYKGIGSIRGRLSRNGRKKIFEDVQDRLDDPNIDKVLESHGIEPKTAKNHFENSDLKKFFSPSKDVAAQNSNALTDVKHQLNLNDLNSSGYLNSDDAKKIYAKATNGETNEIPKDFSDVTTWGKPGSETHKTNSKILNEMLGDSQGKGLSKEQVTRTVETAPRAEKESASQTIHSVQEPDINQKPKAPAEPKFDSGLAGDANTFVENKTDGIISDATEMVESEASTAAGDASTEINDAEESVERVEGDVDDNLDDF